MKTLSLFLLVFFIFSCNSKIDVPQKGINKSFVEMLNDSLYDKINISKFLDSITNQKSVKVLGTFSEDYDVNSQEYRYSLSDLRYKIKVFNEKDFKTNTIFYDGNNQVNFKRNKIITFNDGVYETEEYGFNNNNTLRDLKLIKINDSEFLYGDISHRCNGIGCGCCLTFIYDIKNKKAFFLDNYRFPYDKFFISDFNNDNTIDLLVVSRNKSAPHNGLPCELVAFKTTWFEYINGVFTVKPSYRDEKKETSIEFYSYLRDFHHDEQKVFWSKEDAKWEHY